MNLYAEIREIAYIAQKDGGSGLSNAVHSLVSRAVDEVIGGDINYVAAYVKPNEARAFQAGVEMMVKRNNAKREELFK